MKWIENNIPLAWLVIFIVREGKVILEETTEFVNEFLIALWNLIKCVGVVRIVFYVGMIGISAHFMNYNDERIVIGVLILFLVTLDAVWKIVNGE